MIPGRNQCYRPKRSQLGIIQYISLEKLVSVMILWWGAHLEWEDAGFVGSHEGGVVLEPFG